MGSFGKGNLHNLNVELRLSRQRQSDWTITMHDTVPCKVSDKFHWARNRFCIQLTPLQKWKHTVKVPGTATCYTVNR